MPYKDPEKTKEWRKKYYAEHREKGKAAASKWHVENREHANAMAREYSASICEVARQRASEWYYANPERGKESRRKWRANHREKCAEIRRNRQARERNAIGFHTAGDVARIRVEQNNLCYYCGEPLGRSYHVDHKQPVSRGGSNWPDNLACTCPTCNLRKGAQTESEFVLRQFAGSPCST